ncbi:MAG: hypothetical protein ACR2PB_11265 [Desulfocapsaceae bacterium]
MKNEESAPLSIFGIRIKSIILVMLFLGLLLVVVNRSEIESLVSSSERILQLKTDASRQTDKQADDNHLVVDQEMLSRAMQEVQVEKLTELESQDSTIPTDRFFYVVELVSGGDLEGVDLTIEPDHLTLVSEGGTETIIKRAMVSKIHRFKLPPSSENQQAPK